MGVVKQITLKIDKLFCLDDSDNDLFELYVLKGICTVLLRVQAVMP